MSTPFYLEELRKHVLKKAGVIHVDPGDCRHISNVIYNETKKYVSETTIKRFFGYASTQFNFSGFTLNCFAQFIGFDSWRNFCEGQKIAEKSGTVNVWDNLRQKSSIVTEYSLRAVRNNSGIPFGYTAIRRFAAIGYHYFLKSNAQISCVVAPAGYGKSVAMAQMAMGFLEEADLQKNDILLFINMQIVPNISALGFDLSEWIRQEVGLDDTGFRSYFEQHPEAREGRLLVIIDGFDTGDMRSKYGSLMMNFLSSLEQAPWIKVTLSMRTTTWLAFRQQIYGSAFLLKTLYRDNFFDTEYSSNLPLLSNTEIIQTLNLIDNKNYHEDDLNKELLNQLKTPFWFQHYFHFRIRNSTMSPGSQLLSYELIWDFVQGKIYEDNFSTESLLLLQHIASEMQPLDGIYALKKNKLLGLINAYPHIYQKLLQKGIVTEQKKLLNNTPEEVVGMLHDFYPCFLFRHLLERNNQRVNEALLSYICETYKHDVQLRSRLVKWSLRYAVISNEMGHLLSIITLPLTMEEKTSAFNFVCEVLIFELKKPGDLPIARQLDAGFINLLAKGAISSRLYKKTVGLLVNAVTEPDTSLLLKALQGGFYMLELNKGALKKIIGDLGKHRERLNECFPISPFELLRFHYECFYMEPHSVDIEAYIKSRLEMINVSPRDITSLSAHEMVSFRLAMHVTSLHGKLDLSLAVMQRVQLIYPRLWRRRTSLFSTLSKILVGLHCVHHNEFRQAERLYNHLDQLIGHSKQVYYTNYILVLYDIFKAGLFRVKKDYNGALAALEQGLKVAKEDDLHLFTLTLNNMKIKLLRSVGDPEPLARAYSELKRTLKAHNITEEQCGCLDENQ